VLPGKEGLCFAAISSKTLFLMILNYVMPALHLSETFRGVYLLFRVVEKFALKTGVSVYVPE
jgi:hypothetical protein